MILIFSPEQAGTRIFGIRPTMRSCATGTGFSRITIKIIPSCSGPRAASDRTVKSHQHSRKSAR